MNLLRELKLEQLWPIGTWFTQKKPHLDLKADLLNYTETICLLTLHFATDKLTKKQYEAEMLLAVNEILTKLKRK